MNPSTNSHTIIHLMSLVPASTAGQRSPAPASAVAARPLPRRGPHPVALALCCWALSLCCWALSLCCWALSLCFLSVAALQYKGGCAARRLSAALGAALRARPLLAQPNSTRGQSINRLEYSPHEPLP